MVATIRMIFARINCPNVIELVWRRHTKFQIGMAAALPATPLLAPLTSTTAHFQVTTQGLSVPHLMCRRTEKKTSNTARRCYGIGMPRGSNVG